MRHSTIIIDVYPWWQTRRGIIVALASAGALCGLWWVAAWPTNEAAPPVVPQERAERSVATPPFDAGPAGSTTPMASAFAPAAAPLPVPPPPMPPPPISTMVAPGVHITPLSVPPGVAVIPAGPGPDDSEPEN